MSKVVVISAVLPGFTVTVRSLAPPPMPGQPSDMPGWLERLVDPPRIEHRAVTEPMAISAALDKWAAAALRGEVERVRHAPDGCRNHTLNRAAFALGQIAGIIESAEVESQLHRAALGAGLGEREALLTIRSGISAGLARPRGPAETPVLAASAVDASVDAEVGPP